jgi:hypothetical protein
METTKPDFEVSDHGSIVLVTPLTADAREWLHEHTDGQWYAGGLAVEPGYVGDLLSGIIDEGFSL